MMKIFDYFKRLKERNFEDREPQDKPKTDKVFIAIIIVYILIIAINCIAGIFDFNIIPPQENAAVEFKINISDFIILGVIFIAYLISHFKGKGRG